MRYGEPLFWILLPMVGEELLGARAVAEGADVALTADAMPVAAADEAVAADEVATTGFCFVAGTVVATPEGEQPIEALRVGDRVHTSDDDSSGATSIEPASWRDVRLRMPNP